MNKIVTKWRINKCGKKTRTIHKNPGAFLYGKIKSLHRAVAYCDLHRCYLDGFNVKYKGCNIKRCKHKEILERSSKMTKEQEEAFNRIHKRLKDNEDYKLTQVWLSDDVWAVKTVLTMLIEKDKEIEKLKKHNKDLLRKLRNRVKEVKKLTKYSLYKKEFKSLNKRLEKKEKEIDAMAEHIVSSAIVDDTVCAIKFCEIEENCTHEKMLECTKQYFEKK